jgi:nicotinamide phosphoribosyltransferase
MQAVTQTTEKTVKLPKRKIHKTPRLLIADAYTIGSNEFESEDAKAKSVYYITMRKLLHKIDPTIYRAGDDRLIFSGLARLLDYLFYEPITFGEIEEAANFLSVAKFTLNGFQNYTFPRELWEKVVREYNGRPPIEIKALPEGSVFYPNEPVMEITAESLTDEELGVLAAWFESTLLMVWADTEFVTALEHFIESLKLQYRQIYKTFPDAAIELYVRLLLTDFGARASSCPQEAEFLGESFLYSFGGTDTFAGAYQAWKNGGEKPGIFSSVKALAHRNPQSYPTEWECYEALFESMKPGDIGSFVADVNDFWTGIEGSPESKGRSIFQLALRSHNEKLMKTVVGRPDSGNAVEQVTWMVRLALKHGLYETVVLDGVEWRCGTCFRFIEGNGLSFQDCLELNQALIDMGCIPHTWGIYGMGGHKRNAISRDNTSAKYALCSVGYDNKGVCKFSEELGKTTLPGPFKLRRDRDSLLTRQTIAFPNERGEDARVVFFDGRNIWEPFGPGFDFTFQEKQARIRKEMSTMPKTLVTEENLNFPITDAIREARRAILKKNAPKKLVKNY